MSKREQEHSHKWQRRIRDWLIVPHSGPQPQIIVTEDELAQHKTEGDCWMLLDGYVYNVTPFLKYHPGGLKSILNFAGQDATAVFQANHGTMAILESIAGYKIGPVEGSEAAKREKVLAVAKESGLFKDVTPEDMEKVAEALTQNGADMPSPSSNELSNYIAVFQMLSGTEDGTGTISRDQLQEFLLSVGMSEVESSRISAGTSGEKILCDEFVDLVGSKLEGQ